MDALYDLDLAIFDSPDNPTMSIKYDLPVDRDFGDGRPGEYCVIA